MRRASSERVTGIQSSRPSSPPRRQVPPTTFLFSNTHRLDTEKQWLEPELTRADFDALVDIPEVARYPNLQAGLVALGFDGAFAGTYIG